MRNILNVDLTNTNCNGVCSSACGDNCTEIIINVRGLELTNPFLYFVLQNGSIYQTAVLEIENNEIYFDIPDNIINGSGTITIQLKADNFESEAISVNTVEYTASDELICKYSQDIFKYSICDSNKTIFDKIYPVGAVYISNENKNPDSLFGGTWKLTNKEFIDTYIEDTSLFIPVDDSVTVSGVALIRNGNSIKIRLVLTIDIELTDAATTIGTFDFEKLGVNRLGFSLFQIVQGTDGGNGTIICNLYQDTGELISVDVISRGSSEASLSTESAIYFNFDLLLREHYMLDAFCDKFYWQRTE